jgi:histidine triad (HIT) family protein
MDCLFCKIIKKEIPSKFVYEDELIYAFEDINPQAPVHILLIPKKHIATILDITDIDKEILLNMYKVANKIATDKKIEKDGFRLVVNCNRGAGQSVYHIHMHLLGGRAMTWPPG